MIKVFPNRAGVSVPAAQAVEDAVEHVEFRITDAGRAFALHQLRDDLFELEIVHGRRYSSPRQQS
jgi:hypothetical protein